MIQLRPQEKILMIIRKHWFLLVGPLFLFLLLLLVPPLARTFLPYISLTPDVGLTINQDVVTPLINFGTALYVLALLLLLFRFWMDYYLDIWIVTDLRIIDVDQFGLFSRQLSEVPLHRVQDATIDIHGIIETFLNFGTIRVQTAGERDFSIRGVPDPGNIKDVILKYAKVEEAEKLLHDGIQRL